ncbi:proteasome accessory factor PafA2 family protein, partial [Acinetobacter baumannii]
AVFARSVDWAAKRRVVEQYMDAEGTDWRDPSLRAVDLEYSNIDPEEGLYDALVAMGEVEPGPGAELVERASRESLEPTRARARGAAVSLF